jgi:hypothetical protein
VNPPPTLLPPGARPGFIGPIAVPGDLWWVCLEPTPLAGMAYPRRGAFQALATVGIDHIVDLTRDTPRYDPAPLHSYSTKLSDLIARRRPPDADGDEARIRAAADLVAAWWQAGEGVAVHCHGGRGRTGSVLGVALVQLGHDPEVVVEWLHRGQRARGRRGWPEQRWQAEVVLATPR